MCVKALKNYNVNLGGYVFRVVSTVLLSVFSILHCTDYPWLLMRTMLISPAVCSSHSVEDFENEGETMKQNHLVFLQCEFTIVHLGTYYFCSMK